MSIDSILAFILILITAYYAVQTMRTVREMKEGRELSLLPVLTCSLKEIRSEQQIHQDILSQRDQFRIDNVGSGTALAVTGQIELVHRGGQYLEPIYGENTSANLPPEVWDLHTIGSQASVAVTIPRRCFRNITSGFDLAHVVVTLSYRNAYGRLFQTRTEFNLKIDSRSGAGSSEEWEQREISRVLSKSYDPFHPFWIKGQEMFGGDDDSPSTHNPRRPTRAYLHRWFVKRRTRLVRRASRVLMRRNRVGSTRSERD